MVVVSLNQKKNEENFWKNFPLSHDQKNVPLFISGLTVAIDCLPAVSSTIDILWLPAAATKAPKVTVFEICPMTTPWYHRIVAIRIVNCHWISLSRLGNSTIVRKQPEKTKVAISLTFWVFVCCALWLLHSLFRRSRLFTWFYFRCDICRSQTIATAKADLSPMTAWVKLSSASTGSAFSFCALYLLFSALMAIELLCW